MKKRLTALFLAFALVFALLPAAVLTASAEVYSGTCGAEGDGSNLTWTFDTVSGVLEIAGTGAMANYRNIFSRSEPPYNSSPWGESFGRFIKSVVIGSGVTSIGDCSFDFSTELTSVTIPASVTRITFGPFFGCDKLTHIFVDEENADYCSVDDVLYSKDKKTLISYTTGRAGAFAVPDGVTSIDGYAFALCAGLTSVTIPDSVTSIGEDAFRSCTGLTSVTIPAGVMRIGMKAFGFSYDFYTGEPVKIDGFTIYGYEGSMAQTYAEENELAFVSLGDAPVKPIVTGDIDGSGEVDTIDSIRLAKYLVDLVELTDVQKQAADVNGDGDVTALDGIRLAKFLVGLVETLRPEPAKAAAGAGAK